MANTYTSSVVRKAWLFATLGIAVPLLPLQGQTVSGPQATYFFDSDTGSIRPMVGRAGSSFLSDPVLTGLRAASIAPNGISAVAVWDDRVEWISDMGKYPASSLLLDAALSNSDRFFWGKNSDAVALYSSQAASLRFLQRPAGSPIVTSAIDVSALPSLPRILAVDADHSLAAVLCTAPLHRVETQELFLVQPGFSPRPVRVSDVPEAGGFAENGALYIAGRRSTVSVVAAPLTDSRADVLFQRAESGSTGAVLARISTGKVYLADTVLQKVLVYDLQTFAKVDEFQLGWRPTRFEPFPSNSFLLNQRGGPSEPFLLLQTFPKSTVVFIPAGE